MRHLSLLLAFALAPRVDAEPQKMGLAQSDKAAALVEAHRAEEAAARARKPPKVQPITDLAELQARIDELVEMQVRTMDKDQAAARRLGDEVLALAAASMEAAAAKYGSSPTYRDFVMLAADQFDPGDESAALPAAFRPLAEEVAAGLQTIADAVPADAGPRGDQVKAKCLLLASAIRRATRQPQLALAAAQGAREVVDAFTAPGSQMAQASARKTHALALLAREERDQEEGGAFGPARTVRIPSSDSCREAKALLSQAEQIFQQGRQAVEALYRARGVSERALPRILSKLSDQVGDLDGLRVRAGACWIEATPPLGRSRLVDDAP